MDSEVGRQCARLAGRSAGRPQGSTPMGRITSDRENEEETWNSTETETVGNKMTSSKPPYEIRARF